MKHEDIRFLLEKPENYYEKEVVVCGWVRTVRTSKEICFVEINDGSCLKNIQVVCEINNSLFNTLSKLTIGSSLQLKGIAKKSINEKQPIEISPLDINIFNICPSDYPMQKKYHTLEFLREIPHLRLRTNTFNAMMRVRNTVSYAIHNFFQERGFYYANTPIITGSDCEGAGEMFKVTTLNLKEMAKNGAKEGYEKEDFFGDTVGLTVSGQLEGEAFATALGKIYTFGPTFRAENSNTPRHAAEFWQIEPEVSFADLEDILKLEEDMIKHLLKTLIEKCPNEIEFFERNFDKTLREKFNNVLESDFARVDYTDAIEILLKSGKQFEYPVYWGADLKTEHERYLAEEVYKKPMFLMNFPKEIKSFYMKENPDGKTVAAADLLVPGVGEIIGGSQREDNLEKLEQKIKDLKMNREDYWWYLELRKYGSVPHSGYGLGLERFLLYVTGIGNIRDVIGFPRTNGAFKI